MIAWAFLLLVVVPLFVLMLRRMFFDMLDRRTADEYLRALDEGNRPVVGDPIITDKFYDPRWDDYHIEKAQRQLLDQGYSPASALHEIEKARRYIHEGTQPMYAMVSNPHVMMYGENGRPISPNYSPGPIRFREIEDQI